MPALVAGIHVFATDATQVVYGHVKPGHDALSAKQIAPL
jgi:hypothetical protein